MGTAVEVFWGNKPEVRSEREFLSQLVSDLKSCNLSATILANFFTQSKSRQVDFLIVTDNHVCHVELKNYSWRASRLSERSVVIAPGLTGLFRQSNVRTPTIRRLAQDGSQRRHALARRTRQGHSAAFRREEVLHAV